MVVFREVGPFPAYEQEIPELNPEEARSSDKASQRGLFCPVLVASWSTGWLRLCFTLFFL
jgi:hypothetical protein